MTLTRLSIIALAAAALAACSNAGKSTDNIEVSDFIIRENLKSATSSYILGDSISTDTTYLTLTATVQWPEQLGDYDIKALQDTLLAALVGANLKPDTRIDEALRSYVTDLSMFAGENGKVNAIRVDSVPEISDYNMTYELSTSARISELTEESVTYNICDYAFLGGAHPNYLIEPFTYYLPKGCVVTFDNLFKSGSDEALFTIVKEAMADQLGVSSVAALGQAGVFTDQLFLSHSIFLQDGAIVFHYNTYEIGPYAMGVVDVTVAPFLVEQYLTDLGREILID